MTPSFQILSKQGQVFKKEGTTAKFLARIAAVDLTDDNIESVWVDCSYLGRPWKIRYSEIAAVEDPASDTG